MNKSDVYKLIRAANYDFLVVPRVYIRTFGITTSIFLGQLMRWDIGRPVAMSMVEWSRATDLTRRQIENARKELKTLGITTEETKKEGSGPPLVHISLDKDRVVDVVCEHLGIEADAPDVPAQSDTSEVTRPSLDTLQSSSLLPSSPSETSEVPAARETPSEPDPPARIEQAVVTAVGKPRVIVHKRRKTSANESMATALLLAFRCPPSPSAKVKGRMRRLAKKVLENEYTEQMVKDTGVEWWHSWPGTEGSAPSDDQFLQKLEQHRIGAEKWRKA